MNKKQATPFKSQNIVHGFLRSRLNEGCAIMLFAFAIFLLFCLATYNPADPAWSHISSVTKVNNIAGTIGALLADFMFCLFGITAYAIPFAIVYSSAWVFRGKYHGQQSGLVLQSVRSAGLIMAVVASCGLAQMFISANSMPWGAGGIVGSVEQLMIPVLDRAGTGLLLSAILLAGITLATGLSWLRVIVITTSFVAGIIFWLGKKISQIKLKKSDQVIVNQPKIIPKKQLKASKVKVLEEPKAKEFVVKKINLSGNETLPSLDLLDRETKSYKHKYSDAKLEQLSVDVETKLADFGVNVKVVSVYPGPVITRFEMDLAPGVKVSKITGLAKDLARSLSVTAVRVVEIIPGKTVVGLELPNESREMVRLRDVFEAEQFIQSTSPLSLALGKDIAGNPVVTDLAKMPHLLVAGTTGSGKSVGVNAMLISMLYKATAKELRLLLIDPKMLELAVYEGIPHLLAPVVTDMKDAANALRWCVAEMEHRYKLMAAVGVRNLNGFNEKIAAAHAKGEPIKDPLWKPLTPDSEETAPLLEELPRIVIIIDEFADMIMVVGKQVEELIARIAQKARAAGIHMILATQRPSVDVITGLIKANVPTRIAFQVSSRIDSRTILDQQGAENLLGHGDMLYLAAGTGIPTRVHGAFVSDSEVHSVVAMLKQMGSPEYISSITEEISNVPGLDKITAADDSQDQLYDEAVQIVTESRRASISYLQRRLKIGYNRAACLIEEMEQNGVVSAVQNGGSREVLAPPPIEV